MISDKFLRNIFKENQWITSDLLWNEVVSEKILKIKVDFLFRGGYWRGQYIESALKSCLKSQTIKYLLVSHGDEEFRKRHYRIFRVLGIEKVFATNVSTYSQNNNINAIPIGLTNNTTESVSHSILGDQNIYNEILKLKKHDTKLKVYVNVNLDTHYERKNLISYLKNLNHVVVDEPNYSKNGRFRFILNLRNSDYVVCPRGNGIDTHRLWETLYAGSIPIVVREDLPIAGLQNNLPILVVDNWKEISNIEFLQDKLKVFREIDYNGEMLKRAYWVDKIKNFG